MHVAAVLNIYQQCCYEYLLPTEIVYMSKRNEEIKCCSSVQVVRLCFETFWRHWNNLHFFSLRLHILLS